MISFALYTLLLILVGVFILAFGATGDTVRALKEAALGFFIGSVVVILFAFVRRIIEKMRRKND